MLYVSNSMLPVDFARHAAPAALHDFRRLVLADAALQAELSQPLETTAFAELAAARAQARGVELGAADILAAFRPDPLGLARLAPPAAFWPGRPAGDWLPTHIGASATGAPYVEWTHFAGAPLAEPFFETSARAAAARPFNRLFTCCTRLDDVLAAASEAPARAPDGLIFHMSRCGSTLVAQMLAAMTGVRVISEAPALDAAVRIEGGAPGALAAMVGALGRRRADGERGYVLKLDSWHARAVPLFRRLFPATPWVFLYRDPLEVLVSQRRERGVQTIPGVLPREVFGLDPTAMDDEAYCARVLAMTCEAAADHLALGGGLLARYDDLPAAVFTRILPHFGLAPDRDDLVAMHAAARRNAKAPEVLFEPDGHSKRRAATPRLANLVRAHLAGPYGRLEQLRLSRFPLPPSG